MRKVFLLLILLLFFQITNADITQTATINLTVENQAPEIISLAILPQNPYFDSELECKALIKDESPETVVVQHKWYVNNALIDKNQAKLTDLNDNDKIKCEATPTDEFGVEGEKRTANTTILAAPLRIKAVKPVLKFIGLNVNTHDLTQSTSMNAITGMVIGQRTDSSITLLFMLSIFASTLIILNVLLFGLKFSRRPKQD